MSVDDERRKLLLKGGWTHEQALRILDGEPPPDTDREDRIREIAEEVKGKPFEQWPTFTVKWDLSPEAQRHCLDGMRKGPFAKSYPNGLEAVHVLLADLDTKLGAFNLRTPDEVWSVGDQAKAAKCIAHWAEGGAMTPPLADVLPDGSIGLKGGNHRLAVARAKGETCIPVLIDPSIRQRFGAIVPVQPHP